MNSVRTAISGRAELGPHLTAGHGRIIVTV